MEDTSVQTPVEVKLVFSLCVSFEKPYNEDETKIINSVREYSDETTRISTSEGWLTLTPRVLSTRNNVKSASI